MHRSGQQLLGHAFVQVGEVHAHSPLAFYFFDHDHVGQPVGVVDFPNEICLQQFAYFFGYGFVTFLGEDPLLLPDWGEGRAYVELGYHGIGADPRHVLVTLGEDVSIILQEEGKLLAN